MGNVEITKIDLVLIELRFQWYAASMSDKQFVLARIDYWLDQRLELM